MANEVLKTLYTAVVDAKHGYDEARKDAETPILSEFFGKMSGLHDMNASEIRKVLIECVERPVERGSFMSTVHTSIIAVRATITGLKSALPSFVSGEERLTATYEDAISSSVSPATKTLLLHQQAAVRGFSPDPR